MSNILKSILEALDHTANMFFVILVLWSAIALSIAISASKVLSMYQ